ncbi:uncharacterized protein LOC132203109 [Neocloeon triangulifer]|uniref:uncharacterized protein LOC132203109 n=1 Tax=Neocloeon triangulifer TaxID=2078957 RepID=UPI00286F381C|nr:uncharacterized protein LOC132203109 [Neocloeon triangulifer]
MKVRWRSWCLLVLLVVHTIVATPIVPRRRPRRQTLPEDDGLDPVEHQPFLHPEEIFGPDLADRSPRDKRKARILLNILFWKINTLLQLKTRILGQLSARQALNTFYYKTTTTTPDPTSEDVPEFDSNRVMLDIPGELFGTAFSVVTDVSKIVGDVILNTARRTQKFVEGMKQAVARSLGYKLSALTTSSSVSKSTGESESSAETTDDP